MYQDRRGFLWFGTDRGASRYDGYTFVTFTVADGLGSNFVRRIFEDAEGNIWFGSGEGIALLANDRLISNIRPLWWWKDTLVNR